MEQEKREKEEKERLEKIEKALKEKQDKEAREKREKLTFFISHKNPEAKITPLKEGPQEALKQSDEPAESVNDQEQR